jgi:hypothetical protein
MDVTPLNSAADIVDAPARRTAQCTLGDGAKFWKRPPPAAAAAGLLDQKASGTTLTSWDAVNAALTSGSRVSATVDYSACSLLGADSGQVKEIIVIYKYREEIPNLGPTKTRALILHCRLWGSSENKGTDSGTQLHPLAVHDYMTKYHRTPRPTDYRYKYVSKYVRIHAGQYFLLIEGFNTKV